VAEVALSCFVATTPWSGSKLLCDALRQTGLVGDPRDYFNPLDVSRRSREWGLLGSPEEGFAGRYLTAVADAATGANEVLSVNLPWSHQRWLIRYARAAADDAANWGRSDAQVVESWYPQARYVFLTSGDPAAQAARWALARGGPQPGQPPDRAQVRWIEDLIGRQRRGWELYFELHGLDVLRIEYESVADRPQDVVRQVLSWLKLPAPPGLAG
jgi:LPS sulfotransferase NodH